MLKTSLEERAGNIAMLSGAGRPARGFTEGLGDLNPVDFDLAFYTWPLHRFLIWITVRNLHVKDEFMHQNKQQALNGGKNKSI